MSQDTDPQHKPAADNPWYQLLIWCGQNGDHAELWNMYQHHLCVQFDLPIPKGLPELDADTIEQIHADLPKLAKLVADKNWQKWHKMDFWGVKFDQSLDFYNCHFAINVDFSNAHFDDLANFSDAHFAQRAEFDAAHFAQNAHFSAAHFDDWAEFDRAHFDDWAEFGRAHFAQRAYFSAAHFAQRAEFDAAHFDDLADFSAGADARNDGPMSFNGARFTTQAPRFYHRKLHQDTDWNNVHWPPPRTALWAVQNDIRAYERLRLIARDQGSIPNEYQFFRLEMACRSRELRQKRDWLRFALHYAYGWFDYGHSITAPIWALCGLWLFGAALWYSTASISSWAVAFGRSAASIFPFLRFLLGGDVWADLHTGMLVVAGVQAVLGLLLMFLLALAVRNALRMR